MSKKDELFWQGARALRKLGLDEDIFVCTLCGVAFGHEHLCDGSLTLEHVPPKSIGGSAIILTCKTCNNSAGSVLESQYARAEEHNALKNAISGRGNVTDLNVLVDVGKGVLFEANLGINRRVLQLSIDPDHVNPRIIKELVGDGQSFTLAKGTTIRLKKSFDPIRLGVADLKSAFLAATALFGFSFGLHDRLRPIREQIAEPARAIFVPQYVNCSWLPEGQIGLSERVGMIFVPVNDKVLKLPWVENGADGSYEALADSDFEVHDGIAFRFPTEFRALNDFRYSMRYSLRREPRS